MGHASMRQVCPAPCCFNRLPPGKVLCFECWNLVPGELRDRVVDTWTADAPSEAHRRAIVDAVNSIVRPVKE